MTNPSTFWQLGSDFGAWTPQTALSNDFIVHPAPTTATTEHYPYPLNTQIQRFLNTEHLSPELASSSDLSSPSLTSEKTFDFTKDQTLTDKLEMELFLKEILKQNITDIFAEAPIWSGHSSSSTASSESSLHSRSPSPQYPLVSYPLMEPQFPEVMFGEVPAAKDDADVDREVQSLLVTLRPTDELYSHDRPPIDAPPPRRKSSTRHEPVGPPRPANAFILYRRQQQAHLRRSYPGIRLCVSSKLIATWWKNESEVVKAHYRSEADIEKAIHFQKYPDYQYTTKANKERKEDANARKAAAKKPSTATKQSDLSAETLVEMYGNPYRLSSFPLMQFDNMYQSNSF